MALTPGAKSHWDATQEGILGLEDKKTARKTCSMEKSWSRYYFSINERQEVSCGSCFLLGIENIASAVIILWWSAWWGASADGITKCTVPMVPNHSLGRGSPGGWLTSCATVTLHGTALAHADAWVSPFLCSLHGHVSDRTPYTQQPRTCNSHCLFYLPSILKHRKTWSTPKLLQETNMQCLRQNSLNSANTSTDITEDFPGTPHQKFCCWRIPESAQLNVHLV